MESYKIRVVDEKEELDKKIADLESFFEGELFNTIRYMEQGRMKDQHSIMLEYSDILKDRILAFG